MPGPHIENLAAAGNPRRGRARPRVRLPRPDRLGSTRALGVLAIATVLVIALVYGIGAALSGGDAAPSADHGPALASENGPAETAGDEPVGPDSCDPPAGGNRSGIAVVRALEHAYYVTRDGQAVRDLMAPDAPVGTAEQIQSGIDTIPVGTRYCLASSQVAATLYSVVVTEHRPNGDTVEYEQKMQVRKDTDGTWAVVSISKAGGQGA